MRNIVTLMLVAAILPATFVIVGRAQGGGTPAGNTARAANAPPLVPVRLNADGNFRIAPPYVADPAFTAKPDVPQGRVIRFTMNSAESKIFPTAPAGRGGDKAAPAAKRPRRLRRSRRSIKRFNARWPSTFLPDTCPIPQLPSSWCRTDSRTFPETHRRQPMASRVRSCP